MASASIRCNKKRETNGKTYHRNREESLWPCGKGCYNLLCRKCGATQDGCDLHRRQFACSIWFSHWGCRRFEGPLGDQASEAELSPEQLAYLQAHQQPLANSFQEDVVDNIRIANGNIDHMALPNPPPAMVYNPLLVPAPISLLDGNTLYPGETTVYNIESAFDNLGTDSAMLPASGYDDWVDHDGSQCSTAPSIAQDLRGPDGKNLERYGCPDTGKIWLCEQGQPDFYCWETEHPAYVAPIIGVSQAEADLHAGH